MYTEGRNRGKIRAWVGGRGRRSVCVVCKESRVSLYTSMSELGTFYDRKTVLLRPKYYHGDLFVKKLKR